MRIRRKIWLGLSTALIAGGSGATIGPALVGTAHTSAQGQQHGPAAMPMHTTQSQAGEGGEGGEGGEAGEALRPSLKVSRGLALIEGHLRVGQELIAQGRWSDALPHFLHPTEEIYGGLRGDLKVLSIKPFESALKALAQTVKAHKQNAYESALALARDQIAAAITALRSREKDWSRFAVETAMEALRAATEEYKESIDGDHFAKVVEYQDSRGFVWQAEALVESVAPQLEQADAKALAGMRSQFAELKKAWPAALPPAHPVKDSSEVFGDVARIELHAGEYLK